MDPGVTVEVGEAAGDVMPVRLRVWAARVTEHVDVVQRVGPAQPVLDHGRDLHGVPLVWVKSLEGGDDGDQAGGGARGRGLLTMGGRGVGARVWPHSHHGGRVHFLFYFSCMSLK